MKKITFVEAVVEALREEMRRDESVFLMGEDIQAGVFGASAGLVKEFGIERVRDTPLAECGFIGAAVGAALCGMRPVVDFMFSSFLYIAMDQLVNQAAKLRYMSGGRCSVPIVLRGVNGGTASAGAQHSESPYAMFMNVPGLKVIVPATPYDAKGLLKTAIRDDNPVLCFEHMSLGSTRGMVPEEEYTIPLGLADVKRVGTDVTVVATGYTVPMALSAAQRAAHDGISVEVVDLRTMLPLDRQTIRVSVRKTGRLVIADDTPRTCGAAAEIAASVVEDDETFGCLMAPIKRVTRVDTPMPFSPPLEQYVLPSEDRIITAIGELMA